MFFIYSEERKTSNFVSPAFSSFPQKFRVFLASVCLEILTIRIIQIFDPKVGTFSPQIRISSKLIFLDWKEAQIEASEVSNSKALIVGWMILTSAYSADLLRSALEVFWM